MTEDNEAGRDNERGCERMRMSVMRAVVIASAGACLVVLTGFFYFLGQVYSAGRTVPSQADAIVVFSGEPKRIRVATNLLTQGFGQHLIIVGQDNAAELEKLQALYPDLDKCCIHVDPRSKNTNEDAQLAKVILKKLGSRSLILVTSSFHMPRAERELRQQVPELSIKTLGVSDEYYRIRNIVGNPKVGSHFISQYILFVASWMPGSRELLSGHAARNALDTLSDTRNLGLAILAVAIALVAIFAFWRHKRRYLGSSTRRKP